MAAIYKNYKKYKEKLESEKNFYLKNFESKTIN